MTERGRGQFIGASFRFSIFHLNSRFISLQGNILENNPAEGIVVANQSLVLQNASRARTGIYTCVGSNREGDGESNPVQLDIRCEYIYIVDRCKSCLWLVALLSVYWIQLGPRHETIKSKHNKQRQQWPCNVLHTRQIDVVSRKTNKNAYIYLHEQSTTRRVSNKY